MAAPAYRFWTLDEYFELEASSDARHEFIGGRVYMMAGGSQWHDLITCNIQALLWQALGQGPCRAHSSGQRVEIGEEHLYPDVAVSCADRQFVRRNGDSLINPVVVFEVVSPSTEGRDRGVKAELYRSLPSLKHYFIVRQDRPSIEHYRAQAEEWVLRTYKGIDDRIELPELACVLGLEDIYRGISFDDPDDIIGLRLT